MLKSACHRFANANAILEVCTMFSGCELFFLAVRMVLCRVFHAMNVLVTPALTSVLDIDKWKVEFIVAREAPETAFACDPPQHVCKGGHGY